MKQSSDSLFLPCKDVDKPERYQGQTRIGEELVEENEEVYVEEEPQEAKGEEAEGVHSIGMEGMEDTYDGMYSETDYFLGL